MLSYILRRLLQVIPVFFGATLLIYFLVFAMPGDPILALFGDRTPNPALVEALREQYHLNDPFIVQYWYYITGVLTGDLGTTFSGRSVADVLADTLPVTGRLAIMAIGIEFTLAIIVGTISGLRKGKAFDNIALVVALVAIAIPIFVLCFLAQYFLAIQWGWFKPTVGADNDWGGLWLPALVLGFSLFAVSMRLMRGSVIDTLNQDWVRTAYSKGLSRGRVIPVHVLRNSLIPVITNSATNFGVLLVGATVTEGIFNVPGVGNTLFQAVQRGEGPTVVSFVTVFVILYVLVNLLVDLLYGLLDPRIRYV
ncbi:MULTISPECIES: ABC transporter permease [unclassified Microbacterium]|jgi:oligopeptide transport system permease protein|uniref:ABC transporter permease n=1 Tax=unclassified Microbacterium TaxID=2609290 RepID=UPI000CFD47AA|nr:MULTISPECIES: ABC transporter permease [unclassified Microbacterium]PQZ56427.1 ABC transporter permease [Microbacterium sp. MYb43]PQZ79415.1 ABC transporter permease [Microbacterium sp. MYb40]PRB19983.1 ABC transporter permease [Microbacterium sp. MYb54]PRB26973.1 ABC transporter permease [Microbacterium sp. MYb50]PRB66099.1 ABC transporter permease [Microbacterium sp. MYb24]